MDLTVIVEASGATALSGVSAEDQSETSPMAIINATMGGTNVSLIDLIFTVTVLLYLFSNYIKTTGMNKRANHQTQNRTTMTVFITSQRPTFFNTRLLVITPDVNISTFR